MSTRLTKPVTRVTPREYQGRPIVMTIAPAGGTTAEALIEFRLLGQRTGYVAALSALYQVAALWHGQKLARAKKEARKQGVPWKTARRAFLRANRIDPTVNRIEVES